MARNEVFKDANYLSLPVPEGTLSGDAVRIGDLNGVAQTDEPTAWHEAHGTWDQHPSGNKDGYASIALVGAFRLKVAGTVALDVGDPVYITPAGAVTSTDNTGANALFGHALTPKSTTANQPVVVRIAN